MGQIILLTTFWMLLFIKVAVSKSEHFGVKSTTTKVSATVELSCSSPSPWFFCVWEGPLGDRVCALRSDMDKEGVKEGMCGQDGRWRIRGELLKLLTRRLSNWIMLIFLIAIYSNLMRTVLKI